jgi:hypothetical protein
MPAADFGEVPTQAVFAKDTKSRLFTKRVLKKNIQIQMYYNAFER